ncbi:MAG: hypothetical protein WC107_07145 [Patescibacteria group bacterium]|jgi:hypothetical protein
MARGRMILKSVGRDGNIASAVKEFGPWVAVLHHRLIAFIDCAGNTKADVPTLMANIFPRDDGMTPALCRKLADGLVAHNLAIQYEVDGLPYFNFPNFLEHQVGLRVEREKPECPPFDGNLPEPIRHDAGNLPEDSRNKIKIKLSRSEVEVEENSSNHNDDLFIQKWNEEVCVKIPEMRKVSLLTPERKRLLTARLAQAEFTIENIITALEQSPHARGRPWPGKTESWICDFDWVIGKPLKRGGPDRPDNWIKLYEGNYRDRNNSPMQEKLDGWGRPK